MPQILNWVTCIGCLLVAVISGLQFCQNKYLSEQALQWCHVAGNVQNYETLNEGGVRHAGTFTPKISYHFAVTGREYGGDTISFPKPYQVSSAESDLYKAKYAVGSKVTVFYDKSMPSKSCLEPGDNGCLKRSYWFTLAFLVGAIVAAFAPSSSGRRI